MHTQVLAKTKLNYDKLYADKLVEFGLFLGYDEGLGGHWHQDVSYAKSELNALGFKEDKDRAAAAYSEAGRPMPDGLGEYWVHDSFTQHLGSTRRRWRRREPQPRLAPARACRPHSDAHAGCAPPNRRSPAICFEYAPRPPPPPGAHWPSSPQGAQRCRFARVRFAGAPTRGRAHAPGARGLVSGPPST